MATVTSLTAARMEAIEAASIVDGNVVGDNLILTRFDTTTIDAGSVRGPTGSPGVTDAELAARETPVGSIIDYVGTSAPTNWLTMTGQTIVGGNVTYPDLWAVLPASMKSGSNIVMPDTRGKVSVGYNSGDTDFDTIGETGGSKTHTLTQSELPAATIVIDPPNLVVSINPPNTNVVGTSGVGSGHSHPIAAHHHETGTPYQFIIGSTPASTEYTNAGANADHSPAYNVTASAATGDNIGGSNTDSEASHTHGVGSFTVDIAAFDVNVNIPSFASGNLGTGSAHSIVQPYVTFLKIIKAIL